MKLKEKKKKIKNKKSNFNNRNNNRKKVCEIELNSENIRVVKNENRAVKNKAAPKKKKRKVSKLIKWTSIIFLIIAVLIIICVTPIFNVREIKIFGNLKLSTEKIISLSGIKINDNIFKYSKNKISDSISEDPYIKKVKINKKYPNIVEINIEERNAMVCINILNSFAYIDEDGYILEISQEREKLPILKGIKTEETKIEVGKRLIQDDLKVLLTVSKIISSINKTEIKEKPYSINFFKDEYILILESQNINVYLGNADNLNCRIDAVNKALINLKDQTGDLYADGDFNNNENVYFTPRQENIDEGNEV